MRGGMESRVKRLEMKYSGPLPLVILIWEGQPECLKEGCPDFDNTVREANTERMIFVSCDNSCRAMKGAEQKKRQKKELSDLRIKEDS